LEAVRKRISVLEIVELLRGRLLALHAVHAHFAAANTDMISSYRPSVGFVNVTTTLAALECSSGF
jgi:hypothetical protein